MMTRGPYMTPSSNGWAGFDPNQPSLLPQRLGSIISSDVQGADVRFSCFTREGGVFFCKSDKPGRSIRAVELLATRLAHHINIAVPFCTLIENDDGETFFGSLASGSPASDFYAQAYISSRAVNEFGAPEPWLGRALAAIYAYDQFMGNGDRSIQNFLLEAGTQRLCAYDFADIRLSNLTTTHFLPGNSKTVKFGRFLRGKHGPELGAALEMVDRLDAVPIGVIEAILGEVRDDWLSPDQKEELYDAWHGKRGARLSALRAGLRNESLL